MIHDWLDGFSETTARDFRDLIIGERIGTGQDRSVFAMSQTPDKVLKIEHGETLFQNITEWDNWRAAQYTEALYKWLAPCVAISRHGKVLIQERTTPVIAKDLPAQVPGWLSDLKAENWGRLPNGRVVCHDYALIVTNWPARLRKADWSS